MPDKNKKSFFGNLFSGSEEKKELKEEVQKEVFDPAPEEALKMEEQKTIEPQKSVDPLEKLKVEEPILSAGPETAENSKTNSSALENLALSSPRNDYTKNYTEELLQYQHHQHDFEVSKQNYDKILNEYETLKQGLNEKLTGFIVLSNTINAAKKIYDDEISDYKAGKSQYEEDLKGYRFASDERQNLQLKLTNLQAEFERRQTQLKEITAAATEAAAEFESKTNEKTEKEADLKSRADILSVATEDMELLSGRLDKLKAEFEAEEPNFEAAKDQYTFVTQIKNEYDTLSTQYAKMQVQEEAAKVNLDEVQNVLNQNKVKADVAEKIGDFTITPLSGTDERYQQEKSQFEKTESNYLELKERYDTEAANFARIEKNYSDLSNSDSANRVALHYVTEEYNSAKTLLNRVLDEFKPVEEAYHEQKAAFDVIDANYQKMSKMFSEARENLQTSQKQLDEAKHTYNKVEESYDYIQTQNGILAANLAAKEGQYKEIADDYETAVTKYEAERQKFDPLTASLKKSTQAHEGLQAKIEKAQRDRNEAQAAFDRSSEQLSDVTNLLAEVKQSFDDIKSDSDEKAAALEKLQKDADNAEDLAVKTLETAKVHYTDVSSKYEELVEQYDKYSEVHSSYGHNYKRIDQDYQKTASLYRLADDEYASISEAYQSFLDHGAYVSAMYSEVQKTYEADKDYYDKVYEEYQKVQTDLKAVQAKKQNFDQAAAHLKTLFIQDNSLTFPIYESTGHNYVDNFNLPTLMRTAVDSLSLKEKPQLDAWLTTYQKIREELAQAASGFALSLNQYQETYDKYLEVGGDRLKEVDANRAAYTGIDLAGYVAALDQQVADWMKDYETREKAFAVLLNAYTSYLDREQQLISLVSGNLNIQEGVQSVLSLINSVPDYTDMYSADYGDINQLVSHLGIAAAELTKPRSAEELKQIFRVNYYEHGLNLIKNNVSNFLRILNSLKVNYHDSLENLNKQIQHFQITTGISTDNIQITGIVNDDFDLERYLKSSLEKNYQLLESSVTEVSSLTNAIRRAGGLTKVANRIIDTTANDTLVFNDKPITMSESLMNTEVTINSPRNIPIPIEPDEPTAAVIEPKRPTEMMAKPDYIYQVEMPEAVEEDEDIMI
ncbi:hypothetical protein OfM1_17300 [Lactovum odontotermitis]